LRARTCVPAIILVLLHGDQGDAMVLGFMWGLVLLLFRLPVAWGAETKGPVMGDERRTVTGFVQNQDLRRVPSAIVEVKDQEGQLVVTGVSNDAGEFSVTVPADGTYSVSAVNDTYRSEYVILKIGTQKPVPLTLTLAVTQEIALDIVSTLPPLQYKAYSETYSLSRKEIEQLPLGNNQDVFQVVTGNVPGAAQNGLGQIHIRQEHANLQFRIDGVPIPDTIANVFSDVITPRAWERADILVGGLPAEFGNRNAAVIDITSKSGTTPPRGSVQMFGGSNETINPSFEYGSTIGTKFRYYVLNSYTDTNRGIDPKTAGHSFFHDHNERNQTYLRGDYQLNNTNNFTWVFLNSINYLQVPTNPNLTPDPTVTPIGFTPSASSQINERQQTNNQYGHMVWRHDLDATQYFSLAGYVRQTRATFFEDFNNALAYNNGVANGQDRFGFSTGTRLDYANRLTSEHLVKAGFQVDRTQAVSKTVTEAFLLNDPSNINSGANLAAGVQSSTQDVRKIGYTEQFWVQDQYTPIDKLTLNLGLRYDHIQAYTNEGLISPRLGATYAFDEQNVAHVYYGRLFTPPPIEQVRVFNPQLIGTTAQPPNTNSGTIHPEKSHYFEVGYLHGFGRSASLQIVGYYKLNQHLLDDGQFGTAPLLIPFNYGYGFQRGIDMNMKFQFTENFTGRWSVGVGEAKAKGLETSQFLFTQETIDAINSRFVYLDHSQFVTSSGVLSYLLRERTTLTGQMLFGSGLRNGEDADVNRFHVPSYTTYNVSISHVLPVDGNRKMLFGFDVINLLDQTYAYNTGQGIGFGVAHYGMPRSFFLRATYAF
jgi:outer membrane cobalamin receptor